MDWIYITAEPTIAAHALAAGVNQVMVDLETIGKQERQGHLPTHKAVHTIGDVVNVRRGIGAASVLMVRVNPLGPHTPGEVDAVIAAGADRLMLPMFTGPEDVHDFQSVVSDRVPVTWLVETPEALGSIRDYAESLGPVDRIHFGLNDLSIALGLPVVFAPLAQGLLDQACSICGGRNIVFGIGGVGRIGEGVIPPELILQQHVRLGSTQAILSRAFRGEATTLSELLGAFDIATELARLKAAYDAAIRSTPEEFLARQEEFALKVEQWGKGR